VFYAHTLPFLQLVFLLLTGVTSLIVMPPILQVYGVPHHLRQVATKVAVNAIMTTMSLTSEKSRFLDPKRKVALCYVRQSYARNGEDVISPERQRANIEAYLADVAPHLTLEWYEDIQGHRSGSEVNNRPGWLALEQRLSDPDVACVIANDLARFHRKGWRIGKLVSDVQEEGVHLILAAPGRQIDFAMPGSALLVQLIAMADEYYVADAKARQLDSVHYRRERGITTGNPPFATYRGEGGYLELTRCGAWYLPDATFKLGVPETRPVPGAVWRRFVDTALQILTRYANSPMGYEKIAYALQAEGWPFEDNADQPRRITGDDVRRVLGNWPEYGGLVGFKETKDRKADSLAQLFNTEFIEERAVFPTDLLKAVADRQRENREKQQAANHGVINKAYPYLLRLILCCAQCEKQANEQNTPSLRSGLGGTNQNNILRYRHKAGVACGSQALSVHCHVVEADVVRLLGLLKPRSELLTMLLTLAAKVSGHIKFKPVDLVQAHQLAIDRANRRIQAVRSQYRDGSMSSTEYKRQIAERQREYDDLADQPLPEKPLPPFDLTKCIGMLDKLADLWKTSDPDHRQALAQCLFTRIVYDLDRQRIVDYTLTPWARFFLSATGPLYPNAKEKLTPE